MLRLLRKMLNKRWMVLCLLVGFIIATAMMSSVPIYTAGAMQRMLVKDLQNYQVSYGRFPGAYKVARKLYGADKKDSIEYYKYMDNLISQELTRAINLPVLSNVTRLSNDYLKIVPEIQDKKNLALEIQALSQIESHINIIHGRMPGSSKNGDVYEAMVTQEAVQKLDLVLDKVYTVNSILDEKAEPFKVKIVGVFGMRDKSDPYWFDGLYKFSESFIVDFNLFNKDYLDNKTCQLTNAEWYYAFDYNKLKLNNLNNLVAAIDSQDKWFKGTGTEFNFSSTAILKAYDERAKQLKLTLWVLQVPVLLMLVFYLFMVSQLIIDQEKNEIAVLKSRGASRIQIFNGYFMQSIVLSFIAMAAGPFLGLQLCKILGASNGFMEFVQRTALPVSIDSRAYTYSMYGVAAFMITMLIPVIPASRTTIVEYKQKKARARNIHFWQKYFIDIILLAISCYGLYNYKIRQGILKVTGASTGEIPIDPLLFLMSTLFILSLGLVFLRVFPIIVQTIFYSGRKFWPPALYASLINVGRSGGKDQFLMLFLILTISIGIFNANAARTINTNAEEKVKYSVGADIVMNVKWESNEEPAGMEGESQSSALSFMKPPVLYIEPPFETFEKLSGVDMATKVLKRNDAIYQIGDKTAGNTYFMGINPDEFGKIAWFRGDLLSHHWYQYLNLMANDPRSVLVSRTFEKKYKAKVGDTVYIKWGQNNYFEGIIFGFVDYWPTYNQYHPSDKKVQIDLIVANLPYVQAKTMLEPYEVWAKMKSGATSEQLYNDIDAKEIELLSLKDTRQQIITRKNDPILQGTNGALTLGFVVTMLISTIGFLIYWILSIRDRTLQFGILRAMGISMREIIGMLLNEQILISGTAILAGILAGGLTSELFVPLLQIAYSSSEQIPPFKVTAYGGDYIKLYIIIGAMMIVGFAVLARMISRININQAIKLGED